MRTVHLGFLFIVIPSCAVLGVLVSFDSFARLFLGTNQLVPSSTDVYLPPQQPFGVPTTNYRFSSTKQQPSFVITNSIEQSSIVTNRSTVTTSRSTASREQPSMIPNRCKYTEGKWIKDERKKPLYSGATCKRWLSKVWACRMMPRRSDFEFEHYRWQPDRCDLPTFKSKVFLARMRNKVLAFVGDSLGRQQYQSLMCMLTGGNDQAHVEDVSKHFGLVKVRGAIRGDGTAQRFIKTNTTIIFYWSASLCKIQPLNRRDPHTQYAMHLDRPTAFLEKYIRMMDVLVLNTRHHWNRGKVEANKWVMHVGGKLLESKHLRNMHSAHNFTVHKIVGWLDKEIKSNHTQAKVYFRTLSPRHFNHGESDSGGGCDVIEVPVGVKNITMEAAVDAVSESAVEGTSVHLLNVTYISRYRDDAHISKYRSNQTGQDCLHWCLPGVPDVWNDLLYTQLGMGNGSGKEKL